MSDMLMVGIICVAVAFVSFLAGFLAGKTVEMMNVVMGMKERENGKARS